MNHSAHPPRRPDPSLLPPSLAVNLLPQGRVCVVVGGGRVASRKALALHAAGAQLRVVAPRLDDALHTLNQQGLIEHQARPFVTSDVEGAFLVVAATDDRFVNRAVLTAARAAGALVGASDANWPEGDFIAPAVLDSDGLRVAISTGGRSCRRSRMVKESLARHLRLIAGSDLLVVGVSHDELDQTQREAWQWSADHQAEIGARLMSIWGLHEGALLVTCNRIEVLGVVADEPVVVEMLRLATGFDRLPSASGYAHRGFAAFRHLAQVAAGLRSQSPGEHHIVGQLKQALATAQEQGWAGAVMAEWIGHALHLSKHCRQVLPAGVEVEDLALDRLQRWWGDRPPERAVVLGSGVSGRHLVRGLMDRGWRVLWVYHRQQPELPLGHGDRITVLPLAQIATQLSEVQVVLSAVSGDGFVLGHHLADQLPPGVLLLDLSMPRSIDPALATQRSDLRLEDLDSLTNDQQQDALSRDQRLHEAESIITAHRHLYEACVGAWHGA